jgi:NADP-dependent 3-hydroxy acid dehydrogenase YdfG
MKISSVAGAVRLKHCAAYGATKFAVEAGLKATRAHEGLSRSTDGTPST